MSEKILNKENHESFENLDSICKESWKIIAPFWPLKNLIAVNPLQGLEDLPFEEALTQGAIFFEQKEFPKQMEPININTIKWVQAFFDEGQASLSMPLRKQGFYNAWKKLVYFDDHLHGNDKRKKEWLLELSDSPDRAIIQCFLKLKIAKNDQSLFLTLMLTTLPGWASYIKYRTCWTQAEPSHPHPVSQLDYLAIRLATTCLLWQEAAELITWYKKNKETQVKKVSPLNEILKNENEYLLALLTSLKAQKVTVASSPEAQLVFCIDVRSEPFRRSLENQGDYETLGAAGFFGIPVSIKNSTTKELYASCPVLLKPKHTVEESPCSTQASYSDQKGYQKLATLKAFYQSLKYNFGTSFALVELLGFPAGLWMALKTLHPLFAFTLFTSIVKKIRPQNALVPSLDEIPFSDQCSYAHSILRSIGLTKNFSPLIVFCGHGSATQNNAYASALDCGACGGHHGASNAKIITNILNTQTVRQYLKEKEILIPDSTYFIAAEHTTTTDKVELYSTDSSDKSLTKKIEKLREALKKAGKINSQNRCKKMGFYSDENKSFLHTTIRSVDWAQVRPEWGLAQNASFMVAPRHISKKIDLDGRAFLHSYDHLQDPEGDILTAILTAPMVVGQWINSQYLFSTLNTTAYGSGSKITKNITGKIGIMQGNASDLMTGLPLQSVYRTDKQAYHKPVRLMTIVYAPFTLIDKIIEKQPVLQKLFRNGWVLLISINPEDNQPSFLDRNLKWKKEKPQI